MSYVDGFIAAVPTENKDKYIAHAKVAADVFKEYGALKIVLIITNAPQAEKAAPTTRRIEQTIRARMGRPAEHW